MSFNFFKRTDYAFVGLVSSVVIGSLEYNSDNGTCHESSDTNWARVCQAYSSDDPFGLSSTCNSVMADSGFIYMGLYGITQNKIIHRYCNSVERF
jgi:hypothetical protein